MGVAPDTAPGAKPTRGPKARGASVHLTFTQRGSEFVLSGGTRVASAVALMVVNDARVVGAADGLFSAPPQTWRYIEL
jgi:hypothetical protein